MTFKLIDSGWGQAFDEAVSAKHAELRIVCPYIKARTAERLLQSGVPNSIQVITRFNLNDFASGVSDTASLRLLLNHGAQIRGVRRLHSKLYLFGGQRVIAGSPNLTESALMRNHEFGFQADRPDIVHECRQYFDGLWAKAGANLALSKVDDWDAKLTAHRAAGGGPLQTSSLDDEGCDVGITNPDIILPETADDLGQGFVKFFGLAKERILRSEQVIDQVRGLGCHWACTYPKNKRPRQVRDGAIMFMGLLVTDPDDILIFGRARALHHDESRDNATAEEIKARPWKEIWPHYIRVYQPEFLGGMIGNGVSLNALMATLQAKAFATTERHLEAGDGNTNPRRAYLQQASVELSDSGIALMTTWLEQAFARYGKQPHAALDELDKPDISPQP